MKLYEHYKNKFYKYIGEAKHSETLEDVVIYETCDHNQLDRLWVRPKKMFFETIEISGVVKPRFQKVLIEYKATTFVSEKEISHIGLVVKKAFGDWDQKWFLSTFESQKNFYLVLAYINEKPVGFKLGYELNQFEFYSWLGGVDPEYQGVGLAKELMKKQHEWCRDHGYKKVSTKTQNRFRQMLLLNIQFGFDIIGLHQSDEGGSKIMLEKKLV